VDWVAYEACLEDRLPGNPAVNDEESIDKWLRSCPAPLKMPYRRLVYTATDVSYESLHTIHRVVVPRERQINTANCIHSSEDHMIKRQNIRWPIASMQEKAEHTSISMYLKNEYLIDNDIWIYISI
jgi:hypothetical protein